MCSANARTLMNEEDIDGFSDTRSIDLLAHSSFGWIRTTAKRTMQVAPEGKSYHWTLSTFPEANDSTAW